MRISDWSSDVCSSDLAAVVAERSAKGRFRSLADFAQRLDARLINKRQVENLACAGAFDGLSLNREQAYHAAEIIVRHASAAASERDRAHDRRLGGAEDRHHAPRTLLPVETTQGQWRHQQHNARTRFYDSAPTIYTQTQPPAT